MYLTIKRLKRLILLLFLLSGGISLSALEIYMGNLGSFDGNQTTQAEIQEISALLQFNLLQLNNNDITYKTIFTDEALNYNETIIDSRLSALGVCIFYNIGYVLFGNVYIEEKSNLYTTFIKVYDHKQNRVIYETNFSEILPDKKKQAYIQQLSVTVNAEIYKQITGKEYVKHDPQSAAAAESGGTEESAVTATDDAIALSTDTTGAQPAKTTTTDKSSQDAVYDDEVKTLLKQILQRLNNTGTQPGNSSPAESAGITDETDQPTADPKLEKKQLCFNAAAGYPYVFLGKWQGTMVPYISVEASLKLMIHFINQEAFKFILRQGTFLNYSYLRQADDIAYAYVHLHSLTARLGLDFYFQFGANFAFYIGGGGQYMYNSVDFHSLGSLFRTDSQYAPGAFGEWGIEFLLGKYRNMGLGLDNIVDFTFFNDLLINYKAMLLFSFKM